MEMTLINHPKLHVRIRRGREGPTHDPYGYDEYHVNTSKGKVVFHQGLGTWLKFNGEMIKRPVGWSYDKWEIYLNTLAFEIYTGWSLKQIQRMSLQLQMRCKYCRSRAGTRTVRGFPGEYLRECVSCHQIVGSYFCESEII